MSSNPVKVVTGKCRTSFVHLFEPYAANPDQDPKYSVMLLIPKSDKATMKKLRDAEEAAIAVGKESRWKGKIPKGMKSVLHDGDEEADLEAYPERAGHFYMTVSSNVKYKPGVVDRNVQPILDQSEVYSGCYVRASLTAFPYSVSGNNGVSFGLNHVQKMADGDMLGGGTSATADFDELDDEDEDSLI